METKLLSLVEKYQPLKPFGGQTETTPEVSPALEYISSLTWLKDLIDVSDFEAINARNRIKQTLGSVNFREICLKYIKAFETKDEESKILIEAEPKYQTLIEFTKVFGVSKIPSSDYRMKNMQEALARHYLYKDSAAEIRAYLRFTKGSFQPKSKVKDKLNAFYQEKGMNCKATSTEIEKLYKVKITLRGGSHGYLILGVK